ncbi:hypothetical protein BURPS1106B_0758 [Burkholderia pseudomallei 1106b]|uniref:Uncharacterized protein n=2 Tax=Burkholderia pseudomallei TaxID=28450 RepID=A0A0E1VW82_BURPE|nr:hypothetical protein BURPS1106A_A1230 [Burkholderia pseudomallei 1106a]EEH26189.1 conserved hypothetical protein [Burkholderia pseudomallei Pakistan 9]EES23539.1 hypothetical protein BURPS1106B_0758 [Burkholderia pseudomallei 1106b]EET05168.1 hypothetical protein BURPS1710A_A0375 [Burkholderia pseudomallei 1710a]
MPSGARKRRGVSSARIAAMLTNAKKPPRKTGAFSFPRRQMQ